METIGSKEDLSHLALQSKKSTEEYCCSVGNKELASHNYLSVSIAWVQSIATGEWVGHCVSQGKSVQIALHPTQRGEV